MNKKYVFVLIFGIFLGNLLIYENLSSRRGMREVISNNPSVPLLSSISDSLELEWNVTRGGVNGDYCRALANDSDGNIFVVGFTNSYGEGGSDVWLIKYDKDGNFEWNITWGGADSDLGYDIAIDKNSYIYVAGYTDGFGAIQDDLCLIKFNASGKQEWNITYGGSGSEIANGISIDSSSNVYIVGTTSSFGAGSSDIWVLKYNKTGDLQWNVTWGYGSTDSGNDVILASDSEVYVVGITRLPSASDNDIILIKYDSDGNQLWNVTWGGSDNEYGPYIAKDRFNNIYATGDVYSTEYRDVFLVKFDASGNQMWNNTWGGSSPDSAYGITVGNKDNIWLTGGTLSYGASKNDVFLLKYNPSGNILWNCTWGNNESEIGRGIITDFSNNIIIGGWTASYGAGNSDIFLAKYEDEFSPIINILTPLENEFNGVTPPTVSINIDEPNIDQTWFQLDNGTLKTNNFTWPGTLNQNIWDMVGNGTVSIIVYANDTNNNVGFDEVLVRKDTIAPTSSISFIPHNETNNVNISTLFSLTANDGNGSGISVVKYKINNSNWIDYGIPFNLSAYEFGDYNISYYAIDAVGNVEAIKTSLVKLVDTEISDDFPFTIIIIITALIVGAVGVSIAIILLIRKRRK